ncbi:hypothetical protein BDA96_05G141100 [Sorghum bicolor]|uniref:Uncharacterized protein n=2 Tax=Sorghum bicolor TaxID=4558 RepID=A0A921UFR3_SORBI|nr:hypothetical protein BDA96_05G141100 [Sorghum bicolor]KXG28493.1 hypothetical protein SORBI_3005G128900 [Sorghum bicolor]
MGAKLLLVAFLVSTTACHPIWAQVLNTAELIEETFDGLQMIFDAAVDNVVQMTDILLDNIVNDDMGPIATANGTNP